MCSCPRPLLTTSHPALRLPAADPAPRPSRRVFSPEYKLAMAFGGGHRRHLRGWHGAAPPSRRESTLCGPPAHRPAGLRQEERDSCRQCQEMAHRSRYPNMSTPGQGEDACGAGAEDHPAPATMAASTRSPTDQRNAFMIDWSAICPRQSTAAIAYRIDLLRGNVPSPASGSPRKFATEGRSWSAPLAWLPEAPRREHTCHAGVGARHRNAMRLADRGCRRRTEG